MVRAIEKAYDNELYVNLDGDYEGVQTPWKIVDTCPKSFPGLAEELGKHNLCPRRVDRENINEVRRVSIRSRHANVMQWV